MIDLAEVRRAARRTQVELANALNTSQGQISRIERQSDLLLSTLRAYLTALGVDAQIVIEVGEQTVTYDLTAGEGGTMTTQTEITQKNHRRAVRFFWGLLIGATAVSLIGNITHAVLPYLPRIVVQIGAAAVPPIAFLAAVHGIALAVRAGASGRVYCCAVSAVAAIGAGAFVLSFLALRDLMRTVGYSATTAWTFPVLIDTAVAVSTLMLVALGDKPARRTRTGTAPANTQTPTMQRLAQPPTQNAKAEVTPFAPTTGLAQTSASVQPDPAQTVRGSAHTTAQPVDAERAQVDANLASELIASGVTTQPIETVIAVLAASRDGASINAAAKASGINYRTAQRIVEAAAERRQRQLVAVG